MRPSPKNTAFYSTCNDAYIKRSATALLSIKQHVSGAQLFIISRRVSQENQQLLKKVGIKLIDIDLRGKFTRHWQYPVECYYIFAGPEMFYEKGFSYALYVDGDVLCCANPFKDVGVVRSIAGTSPGDCRGVFCDDTEKIQEHFRLSDRQIARQRIASGIVWFNNKKMAKLRLLEQSINLFDECLAARIPRKGDDSLFALWQILFLRNGSVKNFGKSFNFMPTLFGKYVPNDTKFIHFLEYKPWDNYDDEKATIKKFLAEWAGIYRENFGDFEKKAYNNEQISGSKISVFISEDAELGIFNFGDEFPKDLITKLLKRPIEPTNNPEKAELFAIGSILSYLPIKLSRKVYVWGSGFISNEKEKDTQLPLDQIVYTAVRGEYTKDRLQKYINPSITLGDPGILVSMVYQASRKTEKIGVVPHYVDVKNELVERLRNDERFLVIDPLDSPETVAKEISSCKCVFSSSLHGLIFADSYGIPNARVCFSNKVYGGDYKFKDYCSGVGQKYRIAETNDIWNKEAVAKLIKEYKPINNLKQKQEALIKSFPF